MKTKILPELATHDGMLMNQTKGAWGGRNHLLKVCSLAIALFSHMQYSRLHASFSRTSAGTQWNLEILQNTGKTSMGGSIWDNVLFCLTTLPLLLFLVEFR